MVDHGTLLGFIGRWGLFDAYEITAEILTVLVKNVGPAVTRIGVEKYLGKSIKEMKGQIQKQIGKKTGEAVEGLSEKAGEELKKLLGK